MLYRVATLAVLWIVSNTQSQAETPVSLASGGADELELGQEPPLDPSIQVFQPAGRFEITPKQLAPGTEARLAYIPAVALAPDTPVYLHYGVNGWNLPLAGDGAGTETVLGDVNHYRRIPMHWSDKLQQYQTSIKIPVDARALHWVFCWGDCGSGQWDNNQGQDFGWPITYPYIGPVLIPATNDLSDGSYLVRVINQHVSRVRLQMWTDEDPAAQEFWSQGEARDHSFLLGGLAPGVTYRYQIDEPGVGMSQVYSFTPRTTSAKDVHLQFLVLGDSQDNGDEGQFHDVVAHIQSSQLAPHLIVFAGDLAYNDRPGLWWTFFDKGRPLFARAPMIAAVGNHDTPTVNSHPDSTSFRRYLPMPGMTEAVQSYALTVGDTRWLILNSERAREFKSPDGAQWQWLRSTLDSKKTTQTAAEPTWTFASWHIPPVNVGQRHWQQQWQFRDILRTVAGKLDWHFAGHEHIYQRSHPLNIQQPGAPVIGSEYGPDLGVGFLVVPSAGISPGSRLLNPESASGALRSLMAYPDVTSPTLLDEPRIGYVVLDIHGRTVKMRAIGRNANDNEWQVFDTVSYSK